MIKQIRTEMVVGNKRVILFTHSIQNNSTSHSHHNSSSLLQPESHEKLHLDSWIVISLIRSRLKQEGLVDFDIILETDEPIQPHSLDVLLNVCGVKLVHPRAVQTHLQVISGRQKDLRGAVSTAQELWRNYE